MRLSILALALSLVLAGCGGSDRFRPDETYPTRAVIAEPIEVIKKEGLVVEVFEAGSGPIIQTGSRVYVIYTGWVRNTENQFDSNDTPGSKGIKVVVDNSNVITGWHKGLNGLTQGTRARFHIPAALAWGKKGSPPMIPKNADVAFDIFVLDNSAPEPEPSQE